MSSNGTWRMLTCVCAILTAACNPSAPPVLRFIEPMNNTNPDRPDTHTWLVTTGANQAADVSATWFVESFIQSRRTKLAYHMKVGDIRQSCIAPQLAGDLNTLQHLPSITPVGTCLSTRTPASSH